MNGRNVFLISLDATRADVLLSIAFPRVERIRANLVRFPNCVAPEALEETPRSGPGSGTAP
jgi:hypothetical protein